MTEFHRVGSEREIAQVAALAREIWTEHYTAIIGPAQADYMLEKFQSPEAIRRRIEEGCEYRLVVHDGAPAGYLAVQPEPDGRTLFLSKIYVRKDCRGLRLGQAALELAVEIARRHGRNVIRLTVNKHNARTIAWYERMGFSKVGTVVHDIGGGFVMDDFVIKKTVGTAPGQD